jgi:hypothetical protein
MDAILRLYLGMCPSDGAGEYTFNDEKLKREKKSYDLLVRKSTDRVERYLYPE